MQAVMNLVWDKLLPALQPNPLPPDPVGQKNLEARLASLAVRTSQGATTSPQTVKVAGRKFVFPANDQKLESLSIIPDESGGGVTLVVQSNGAESRYACGHGEWKKGRGPFRQYRDEPVAASAAWASDDTLVIKVSAYETPFYATIRLRFEGDQVVHDREVNVGFGPTKWPQLIGRAE